MTPDRDKSAELGEKKRRKKKKVPPVFDGGPSLGGRVAGGDKGQRIHLDGQREPQSGSNRGRRRDGRSVKAKKKPVQVTLS